MSPRRKRKKYKPYVSPFANDTDDDSRVRDRLVEMSAITLKLAGASDLTYGRKLLDVVALGFAHASPAEFAGPSTGGLPNA